MIRYLFLVLFLISSLGANAATWYVRPVAGGPYGSDNGTSYADAWDGFAAVVWGVSGVNSGDTLKVCGSFVTADYDGGGLAMLSVDQSNVIIDGDCSANGGSTTATFTGDSLRDYGLYCHDNTSCPNQTWKNFTVSNFELRGFYVRNGATATNSLAFTGTNLACSDILGGTNAHCFTSYGTGASWSNLTGSRTSDDMLYFEGDDFLLDTANFKDPAYLATSNLGDCVQGLVQTDNAKIRRLTCDHRNAATKQCVILSPGAGDDNAEISDNVCLYPTTGNSTYLNKPLYSDVPGTLFYRNFVLGGYYGIYMLGAGSTAVGNVVAHAELRGIDAVSTVSSGTHLIANNTVVNSNSCFVLNGASSSVTINLYNNIAANCTTAYTKATTTYNQSNNACWNNTTCSNGAGTIGITGNPYLTKYSGITAASDVKPFRAGSSLNRTGIDLGAIYTDINGRPFYRVTPSVGAYEFTSGFPATERTAR